jgi:hypothetical protein
MILIIYNIILKDLIAILVQYRVALFIQLFALNDLSLISLSVGINIVVATSFKVGIAFLAPEDKDFFR